MGITRLNHAVLFVRDVERSVAFYTDAGLPAYRDDSRGFAGAAFLQARGRRMTTTSVCSRSARLPVRREPAAVPSGCTTWRGRSTR